MTGWVLITVASIWIYEGGYLSGRGHVWLGTVLAFISLCIIARIWVRQVTS